MMCLWASYAKKYEKKFVLASLKTMKKRKESDPELDPDLDQNPDPLVRGVKIRGSGSAPKCHGSPTVD